MSTDFMIMDEAQRLKNWNTQVAQAMRRIHADYMVVLSGTPLENKLQELYSIVQIVNPFYLVLCMSSSLTQPFCLHPDKSLDIRT